MSRSERLKAERERRRKARICMYCQAGLQETDVVLCVECADSRADAQAKYETKRPNRPHKKLSQEARIKDAERRRGQYHSKVEQGICVQKGCTNQAVPGEVCCKKCRQNQRNRGVRYFRSKTWPRILAINLWRASAQARKDAGFTEHILRFKVARMAYNKARQSRQAA